jgi:hypothetical protein
MAIALSLLWGAACLILFAAGATLPLWGRGPE